MLRNSITFDHFTGVNFKKALQGRV